MATPKEDPISGVLHDIKLLRDQVDELQIQTSEKRTAWFRQPSLLISIMALLVSTVTTIGTVVVQDRAKNLADLQQLTMDIEDISKQAMDLDFAKDPSKAATLSSLLNTKREILIARAIELTGKMSSVPPEILLTLGYQKQIDGYPEAAEKMYLEVLKQHTDAQTQVTARRSLASLYMTPPASASDLAKARQQFATAIDLLRKKNDDYSIYQRGYTYQVWGAMEFANDQVPEGKQAYANAAKWFNAISPADPLRQSSLSALPAYESAAFRATSIEKQVATKLPGTWKGSDKNQQLELTINSDDTGGLTCTITTTPITTGFALPAFKPSTASGIVSLEDDTSGNLILTIPNFAAPSSPTTVTFKLRISDPSRALELQEVVDGKWQWVTLTRA